MEKLKRFKKIKHPKFTDSKPASSSLRGARFRGTDHPRNRVNASEAFGLRERKCFRLVARYGDYLLHENAP